jgi:magnesium transporter
MGFLQICAGVVLLQMSKSAKDVPDAAIFKGDLDQIREIGEQEQPESEPKADAIRGTAALIRRISVSRQKKEEEEAKRYHEEKMKDQLEPVAENEIVEWDGLRRRKTIISDSIPSPLARRKTIHPPLGMSRFPDESEQAQSQPPEDGHQHGFFEAVRSRASSVLHPHQSRHPASDSREANGQAHTYPVALADIKVSHGKALEATEPGSLEEAREHIYGLPPGLLKPEPDQSSGQNSPRSKPLTAQPTVQSPAGAPNIPLPSPLGKSTRRQFSFQNMFRSPTSPAPGVQQSASSNLHPPPSRSGIGSRTSSAEQRRAMKTATEEERLGLVKGDSHAALLDSDLHSSDHDSDSYSSPPRPLSHELKYPYAAPTQDSVESSPEAHTPLVPKHSYLLSSSTIADHAPFYKEPQTPTYRGSGHGSGYPSAPPPPLEEEEAGVDYDDWQIPSTRREPQPPQHPYPPPTPRFPQHHSPTASSPPPPPQPSLQSHEKSQLPAYHNTNPFSPPQQLRHIQSPPRQEQQQQQHLHEPAPAKAPPAVGSDPFPNTPTTQLKNMITDTISSYKNTSSAKHRGSDSSSRPLSQETGQSPGVRSMDPPPVGIRVTSPDEVEYEERRRRFANKKSQQSRGQSKSRGGEREHDHEHGRGRDRDEGAGGAGVGAFI